MNVKGVSEPDVRTIIELYINISPEEEICLILISFFMKKVIFPGFPIPNFFSSPLTSLPKTPSEVDPQ